MTIPKAIELLQIFNDGYKPIGLEDLKDAIRLGIEALKKVKRLRTIEMLTQRDSLPGETKE